MRQFRGSGHTTRVQSIAKARERQERFTFDEVQALVTATAPTLHFVTYLLAKIFEHDAVPRTAIGLVASR